MRGPFGFLNLVQNASVAELVQDLTVAKTSSLLLVQSRLEEVAIGKWSSNF